MYNGKSKRSKIRAQWQTNIIKKIMLKIPIQNHLEPSITAEEQINNFEKTDWKLHNT